MIERQSGRMLKGRCVGGAIGILMLSATGCEPPPPEVAAFDQSLAIEVGSDRNVTLSATDLQGDSLTFTIIEPPGEGSLVGGGSEYVYTPPVLDPGECPGGRDDLFRFEASDGEHVSDPATVRIWTYCGSDGSGRTDTPEFAATGFYRVGQHNGRWWFVDPDGYRFYSLGVNHLTNGYTDAKTGICPHCDAVDAKYVSNAAYKDATAARLLDWGFNTVGAWSHHDDFYRPGYGAELAQTPILGFTSGVDDYFSAALETKAAAVALERVAPYRDDPNILGWFIGNEMHWGPDWRSANTLLDDYLQLPAGSPGRLVAESYAGDPGGFLLALADRFFDVVTTAVRAQDPNHLILGVRASTIATPPEVMQAAAPWFDVFSINHYDLPPLWQTLIGLLGFETTPIGTWLETWHDLSGGLPVMITEFTYRSRESDVPNTYPPIYYLFKTQAERAEAYRNYVTKCFDSSFIIGHHWFEYFDDPPGGRSDGEDSNFGIVNGADDPYPEMTQVMSEVNALSPHLP